MKRIERKQKVERKKRQKEKKIERKKDRKKERKKKERLWMNAEIPIHLMITYLSHFGLTNKLYLSFRTEN